ncbi:hypothetical protein TNCV_1370321 [Trichonephila clavipes]|nr:hypothetical protein TNCV_1370321 [Trichonephila clavipes]
MEIPVPLPLSAIPGVRVISILTSLQFLWAVVSLVVRYRTPDRKAWVRCLMPPKTLQVHTDLHAEIVDGVSPSIVPSGNFAELKSHCHLYGAQGQQQAYLLPMPR